VNRLTRRVLFACLLLIAGLPGSAEAQDEEGGVTFGVNGEVVSQYVWRGFKLYGTSLQPDAWMSLGNLTVGVWSSIALEGDFNEFDYYVSWYSELPVGELTLTWQDYFYPEADGDLGDFFNFASGGEGAHTVEILGEFSPTALPVTFLGGWNALNDPDHSAYGGVRTDISLPSFDLSAEVGMALNESPDYYGTEAGDIMYYGATVSRGLPVIGSLGPYVSASVIHSPIEDKTFWVFALGF